MEKRIWMQWRHLCYTDTEPHRPLSRRPCTQALPHYSATYQDRIQLGASYSYEKIEQGILPKLYDTEGKELLPNQKDTKLPEEAETEIEMEEVEAEKTAVDTVTIRIVLKNTMNRPITKIEIEDMKVKITNNTNQNGKTYLDVVATPMLH